MNRGMMLAGLLLAGCGGAPFSTGESLDTLLSPGPSDAAPVVHRDPKPDNVSEAGPEASNAAEKQEAAADPPMQDDAGSLGSPDDAGSQGDDVVVTPAPDAPSDPLAGWKASGQCLQSPLFVIQIPNGPMADKYVREECGGSVDPGEHCDQSTGSCAAPDGGSGCSLAGLVFPECAGYNGPMPCAMASALVGGAAPMSCCFYSGC